MRVTILAGGIGSRFWPLSTPSRPKQLLPLAGSQPLIRQTVERALALAGPEDVRVLAGTHLVEPFRTVLPELPTEAYMVEPRARGTAPVLAWAAWEAAQTDPDTVLVSLHSDHVIHPLDAFTQTLRGAAEVARRERLLLCLGAVPDRVETGYGHIQAGAPVDAPAGLEAFRVDAFHEKPDPETAARYTREGFLWNTGIFVWTARAFLDEVERHAPELARCLALLDDGPERFFQEVPSSVVDRAVLERSDRVGCVRATFAWDDVGSWGAVPRTRELDEQGNVTEGRATVVDGSGNVAWADDGRVVVWGVDDLVVVRTGDVTLVMPRDRAPDLKTLLAEVEDGA